MWTIDDPSGKPPAQILAFDSAKKREAEGVDLESPFFTIQQRPPYPACDHRNRGVTLDVATRRVFCLCGEQIDAFDALLIYAHAQRRLVAHAEAIKEHERKEAEKKAKRPFVKKVVGFAARHSSRGRVLGFDVSLDCGHSVYWDRRKQPRQMTCEQCFRNARLEAKGVAIAKT